MVARRPAFFLLPVIYLGFISLGLPDGTLGVAWPAIYPELGLPIGLVGTITIVVTLLSGAAGFSSGRIIARFQTGPVVMVSCALTGSALLLVAHAPGLAWLVIAAVPLGLGAGAVDAGLNGFVARHYSGRHMNWLHACWGLGATCGPLVMGQAVISAAGWRGGYLLLGAVQLTLALLFLLTLRLWASVPERATPATDKETSLSAGILAADSTAGWLSPAIFALYAGLEATTGLWVASILMVGRGFSPGVAALCTAGFYGAITGGRILVGFVVDRWGNRTLVSIGAMAALVGAGLFVVATSTLTVAVALVVLGLGLAPVYPCLMHEVPRRFAANAAQTVIGRQSGAANLGVAIIPAAAGWLAQRHIESIPWVVVAGALGLIVSIRWLDRLSGGASPAPAAVE
ncbi:MFS transporter [Horticoccus sp. 23ND18S-11]|uniref:MFS transporter n=1 Tax=Horticoccus sp. 23ND18S-11 TaxID=3391832 RepID=UPI0039C9313D